MLFFTPSSMSEITKQIRTILASWVDAIDADNSHIPEEQEKQLLDTLKIIASPYVSAYTAQRIAKEKQRSTFYNKIKKGILPKGEHIQGFKEAHYNKYLVEKAAEKSKRK